MTVWTTPLVIDPDAESGRASLVGSTWQRRKPLGDAWDGPVRIVGVWDNGPDNGGLELVVQCVAFGEPTLTASPESFGAAYTRVRDDDPTERLDGRLRELEARSA